MSALLWRKIAEHAVAQGHAPVGESRRLDVVGDEQHAGFAFVRDRGEQRHDLVAAGAVEVACRLVGEDQLRFAGERLGDRDALALAAGELLGGVLQAIRQADALQPRERTGLRLPPADPAGDQLDRRVLQCRGLGMSRAF